MEDKSLNDYLKKFFKDKNRAQGKDNIDIWYNEAGDCIQFQSTDVAIIADRIDDYLTIYRSAEDNKAIGFQLKDVKALIKKYGYDGISVEAQLQNNSLVSVRALLLRAFGNLGQTIGRNQAYARAMKSIPSEIDEVAIPV